MFAVVRTGGKQYRVAPGDKIVVEKLDGSAGDKVTLGDVLLAGDGGSLKSTDGLTVAAEIVAQAKADKNAAPKADAKPEAPAKAAAAPAKPAKTKAADQAPAEVNAQPTENPAPENEAQANPPAQ